MATLVNTFTVRRPRIALWWLGVLLLGSPAVLDEIILWLQTTEGQRGLGLSASSWPNTTVSIWTGSPNSFWDEDATCSYLHKERLSFSG